MIGGQVHGICVAPYNGQIPVYSAKYWIKHAITGIPINGIASIGFITIGVPNRTGSLIPNNAGIIPTLPSAFNCFDFAKKNIYITSPIVIPAPVILIN